MKNAYPRLRIRDNRIPSHTYNRVTTNTLTVPPTIEVIDYIWNQPRGSYETMRDIVVPNYASISAKGGIINNPMVVTREVTSYQASNLTYTKTWPVAQAGTFIIQDTGLYGLIHDLTISPAAFSSHMGDLIDTKKLSILASVQARKNISKLHVQSLVSLAELPKTLNLLRDTAVTLARVIRGIKTGNHQMVLNAIGGQQRKGSKPSLGSTAKQRWLEYRYGWTPLVMEVQGALKALAKDRLLPQRATARGRQLESRDRRTTAEYVEPDCGLETYTFDYHEDVIVRAYCLYQADLKYQSARDFGITELPLAAWELVPFSFVVDWFIQIGDWLEAVTPKLGIVILAEGLTVQRSKSCTRTCISWVQHADGVDHDYAKTGSIDLTDTKFMFRKERVTNLSVLASVPPINVKINVKRTLDAIALLTGSRGNRSPRT